MTQNDVNFLQEALGNKCSQLIAEIVNNNNIVANMKQQEQRNEKPKKQTKKESD